jgi:SOCE-associated regulatory factor of calcium homoeostasis
LTLYKDEPTLSRRGQPIPQLVCTGEACKLFTPDVIRCVNLGGESTEVDWKVCPSHPVVVPCTILMVARKV